MVLYLLDLLGAGELETDVGRHDARGAFHGDADLPFRLRRVVFRDVAVGHVAQRNALPVRVQRPIALVQVASKKWPDETYKSPSNPCLKSLSLSLICINRGITFIESMYSFLYKFLNPWYNQRIRS